jgi:hypothetical protein
MRSLHELALTSNTPVVSTQQRARYLSMPCSWSRPCAQFERSYKINTYFDALVHCSECQASRAMGASSR